MNPREFNSLAGELAKATLPAKVRSAVSRAYYSAFHVGIQTLTTLGFSISKGGAAHGEVTNCFLNASDVNVGRAASMLRDLHAARLLADYQLSRLDIEKPANAPQAVEDARQIIETFERILTGPTRAPIQAAIAAWRKSNGYR